MFKFAIVDLRRIATAAVGALVLSTACVGAAVAPARAVEMAPVAASADPAAGEAVA